MSFFYASHWIVSVKSAVWIIVLRTAGCESVENTIKLDVVFHHVLIIG